VTVKEKGEKIVREMADGRGMDRKVKLNLRMSKYEGEWTVNWTQTMNLEWTIMSGILTSTNQNHLHYCSHLLVIMHSAADSCWLSSTFPILNGGALTLSQSTIYSLGLPSLDIIGNTHTRWLASIKQIKKSGKFATQNLLMCNNIYFSARSQHCKLVARLQTY